MRDLLGGKGAGLAEMTRLGLPVPPGFTITTKACNAYARSGRYPPGLWKEVEAGLAAVEAKIGRRFGIRPRLSSCPFGPARSSRCRG